MRRLNQLGEISLVPLPLAPRFQFLLKLPDGVAPNHDTLVLALRINARAYFRFQELDDVFRLELLSVDYFGLVLDSEIDTTGNALASDVEFKLHLRLQGSQKNNRADHKTRV